MTNKLLEHFKKMQERLVALNKPGNYIDMTGNQHQSDYENPAEQDAFIDDIATLLDGPEQREAQAEAEFDYQQLALRTESGRECLGPGFEMNVDRLLHAGLGLATEAGEFLDPLKKHFFYGKPIDETNLKEEVGDILWYCAIACDALGTTIDAEMRRNIAKLRARFPDKFSEENANVRDLDVERAVLEQ